MIHVLKHVLYSIWQATEVIKDVLKDISSTAETFPFKYTFSDFLKCILFTWQTMNYCAILD